MELLSQSDDDSFRACHRFAGSVEYEPLPLCVSSLGSAAMLDEKCLGPIERAPVVSSGGSALSCSAKGD